MGWYKQVVELSDQEVVKVDQEKKRKLNINWWHYDPTLTPINIPTSLSLSPIAPPLSPNMNDTYMYTPSNHIITHPTTNLTPLHGTFLYYPNLST